MSWDQVKDKVTGKTWALTKNDMQLRGVEWVHGLFLFPLVLGKM